jgi:hypothetical protein
VVFILFILLVPQLLLRTDAIPLCRVFIRYALNILLLLRKQGVPNTPSQCSNDPSIVRKGTKGTMMGKLVIDEQEQTVIVNL